MESPGFAQVSADNAAAAELSPNPNLPADPLNPPSDRPNLPDIGDDEGALVQMVNRLAAEANTGLDQPVDGKHTLREIRTRCVRRYLGDMWDTQPRAHMKQFTLNRTSNAVVTQSAVQTEDPVRMTFNPVEHNERADYMLTDAGAAKVQQLVAAGVLLVQGITPDMIQPRTLLDPTLGKALEGFMEANLDPMTGAQTPAILTDQDLIVVNDALVSDLLTNIWERMWALAFGDMVMLDAQTSATTIGDQPILWQWDVREHRFRLFAPAYCNWYSDPTATWIKDAQYLILDQDMSEAQAIAAFPRLAAVIRGSGSAGSLRHNRTLDVSMGPRGETPQSHPHVALEERHVTIRTLWKRNSYFPVEPTNEQYVVPNQVPVLDELGQETSQFQQQGYLLVADPTLPPLSGPDDPNWPRRPGIRQVQMLVESNRILDDRECPYADIPMPWLKNLPIPLSPYGLGEPARLEDLDNLINRLWSIIYNHLFYYQHPQEIIPRSVYDALKEAGTAIYAHPGRQIPLDDAVYAEFLAGLRGGGFAQDPPRIGDWVHYILQMAMSEHDRLAGAQDALQGASPSSDPSGKAIEALQDAGRGPMAYKAKYQRYVMEWFGRLFIRAVTVDEWLPDQVFDRYSSRFIPEIRATIRQRARAMEFDVSCDVLVGQNARKTDKMNKALAAFDRQAMSREDLLDALDFADPKGMARRRLVEDRMQAATAPPEAGKPAGDESDA